MVVTELSTFHGLFFSVPQNDSVWAGSIIILFQTRKWELSEANSHPKDTLNLKSLSWILMLFVLPSVIYLVIVL